ncbi:hypothetical protein [Thalassoroseus pseudoceratinae]|uniref:hypothetical protein n=1 Tax=Thalassoroseus pseudoceratinae TaxID=2713176 RepID=UPI001F0E2951|nr:hypothetical protein [Thalassoroseus pseudoceratinae]
MPNQTTTQLVRQFCHDENGFIVSAELVIIATLLVIGLVVGLSEVQHAVVSELNDVGDAIGQLNQSYYFGGFLGRKYYGGFGGYGYGGGIKAYSPGSAFADAMDACDGNGSCSIACAGAVGESGGAAYSSGATCSGGVLND